MPANANPEGRQWNSRANRSPSPAAHRASAKQSRSAAQKGARVFIADINEEGGQQTRAAIRDSGLLAEFVKLDLGDTDSIDAFVQDVWTTTSGAIDGLVNAAGWEVVQPFLQSSPDTWERIIRINLMGAIRLTHVS